MKSLETYLNRHLLGFLTQGIGSNQTPDGIKRQLDIIQRIPWHHHLVQVTIKRHLLHVVIRTHLHERLPSRVRPENNQLHKQISAKEVEEKILLD